MQAGPELTKQAASTAAVGKAAADTKARSKVVGNGVADPAADNKTVGRAAADTAVVGRAAADTAVVGKAAADTKVEPTRAGPSASPKSAPRKPNPTTGTRPKASSADVTAEQPRIDASALHPAPEGTAEQPRIDAPLRPAAHSTSDVTAEQPRIDVPHAPPAHPESAMIIAPPAAHKDTEEVPGRAMPHGLAAATSAAHQAASLADTEAELRRTGGSVTPTRGSSTGTGPTIGPPTTLRPPVGGASGAEFRPANASAGHSMLPPMDTDGVIEGTFSGAEPPLPPQTRRMYQRRRRLALLVFLVLAVVVLVVGQLVGTDDNRSSRVGNPPVASAQEPGAGVGVATAAEVSRKTTTAAADQPADTADTAPTKAAVGTAERFRFVSGTGPVLGTAGIMRRFKVAVEKSAGQGDGADFAHEVDRILGDPRSWIASGQFRLQRVPQSGASEFTIYLASADTSEKMCALGGLKTDGFTSCRLPGQVIMNLDRWQDAVPDYDAPLETYRAYAINHEVGHQLGHSHEQCPGKDQPAPVMMQQTYGLRGCIANSWPFVDGKRYAGSPAA